MFESLNPFSPKDNTNEVYKQNRALDTNSNVMQNALPGQATDEQLFLDQRKDREDLTKWQQNLDPELVQLAHDLRREYLDDKTDKWVKEQESVEVDVGNGQTQIQQVNVKPICNEHFIRKIIMLARPSMSRNLMMSNYSDEKIQNELRSITFTLIHHLGYNYKNYDIDKGDLSLIIRLFKSVISPTFYRAFKDGERKHLNTIRKSIETHSEYNDNQKKKGILGFGG